MNLKKKTHKFIDETLDMLFPVRIGIKSNTCTVADSLEFLLLDLLERNLESSKNKNEAIVASFIKNIPTLRSQLVKDIEATYQGDPASTSENEIILAYPGFQATACYRIAHFLLNQGVPLLPRIITEYAHGDTGIDIHPGAKIGDYLCIDHGTGVVIGETTVIGDWVKIYQGVTLGALSVPDRNSCVEQRHPTIGNHVIIYAQAIILGGDTVIGDHSIIGGNVWLTESVSPNSRIYFNNSGTITNKSDSQNSSS